MENLNAELFKDEKLEQSEMGKIYGGQKVSKAVYCQDIGRWDITWDA
jgi:hypothetical protein